MTKSKSKSPLKLVAFDAARYLDCDEAVAEYMTAVLEANDPDLLLLALSDVARAKGMAARLPKTLGWVEKVSTRRWRQAQSPASRLS